MYRTVTAQGKESGVIRMEKKRGCGSLAGAAGPVLACVPAAFAMLAGYGGVADVIGAESRAPVIVEAAEAGCGAPDGDRDGKDEYTGRIAADAVSALAEGNGEWFGSLFSESVRNGDPDLDGDVASMMASMKGSVVSHEDIYRFDGARSGTGGQLAYEYSNAVVSGIRTDGGGLYELRLCVFWDGQDAGTNRGLATASLVDVGYMNSAGMHGRACCVNVGHMPVC